MSKIFLIVSLLECSLAANILFVGLLASPSHQIWNEVLVDGLLQNGHNITKIGYFPAKIHNPNYTLFHIDVEPFLNSVEALYSSEESTLKAVFNLWEFINDGCKYAFKSEHFKTIMDYPKDFFELIIIDITYGHCYLPLIDHFGAPPTIGVTAFGMQPYLNDFLGHRTENYEPFYALPYTDHMNFFQRFSNVIHQSLERLSTWYIKKEIEAFSSEFYQKPITNIDDYSKRISLIFSNDDPVLKYPRAFPPNVIPVGGIQVRKPKKLDNDVRTIMDNAKDGVIFVSMGTNFRTKHYGEEARRAFVETFSRLNQTVLWKFDGIEVPKNVILKKWFSQTDILAHPNTKLFITHCGGLSTQETIIRGVPVVGVPVFLDQRNNGRKLESVRGGVLVPYSELSTEKLYNAIVEVLNNSEYKNNMKKLSKLYQTQPQQPIEKFILWTEYILKNGHLDHLYLAAKDMRWYQIDNWDILLVGLFIVGFIIMLLRKLYFVIKSHFQNSNKIKSQ